MLKIFDLSGLIKRVVSTPHHLFRLLLLTYRWISLGPVLWLVKATPQAAMSGEIPLLLFVITVGLTLFITVMAQLFKPRVLENPFFLSLDILYIAALLTFSGVAHSPYYLYALSPFLAGAFFFRLRGALLTLGSFTLIYLLLLVVMVQLYPIVVELDWLFAQLVGIWLVAFLLAIFSDLLRQHQQSQVQLTFTHNTLARQHEELVANHDNLARQKAELAAAHHQLEIIHDMTLLLQGASDIQSIQQRVLRAITTELKFSQAVLGLVNSTTRRLEGWQLYPPNDQLLSVMEPLPLNSESGFMVQELLNRRGGWWFDEPALVADEVWNEWLSQTPWLMVPLIFQEQPVGLLLVTVAGGPDSVDKEQLVVLTAVASQAAMALGTIERVQQLAVEQERNRIARDIHDTVAQSLFGTVFTLDACIKMLPGQVELVQDELIELRNLAEQVHQQVRRSILNLWPSELTINQFKTDLCQYVNHYASSPGFQIDFTIGGDFDGLSPAIRRNLYRVAQEALANVVKHAGVNSARLSLYVEPHEVQLSIRDQGKGFDPKAALTRAYDREKFGLRGVCERVEALGGECEILSQIEQGSQILVRIPTDRSNGYG